MQAGTTRFQNSPPVFSIVDWCFEQTFVFYFKTDDLLG